MDYKLLSAALAASAERNVKSLVNDVGVRKAHRPTVTCLPEFSQEIDSIPWDEVGHKTGHREIEKLEIIRGCGLDTK
jgi:hypothetical protein